MRAIQDSDRPLTKKERVRFAGALAALAVLMVICQGGCSSASPELAAPLGASAVPSERGPDETAAYVMKRQASIIRFMEADYGVHARVVWAPCDSENSFYFPEANTIGLCTEMLEHPGAAVAFAAHEMGHAVLEQLANNSDEGDADELGALALAGHEYWDDMLAAAIYMRQAWPSGHIDGDTHPPGLFRVMQMMCFEEAAEAEKDASRPAPKACADWYRGTSIKWYLRLDPALRAE